jgi:uncharacterized membrane protein YgdD (TMEM256/DUF423 family)
MNPWLAVAALNGLIAVAAGALGAHGLQSLVDAHAQQTFETAARYQMYHALAIGLGALAPRSSFTTLACVLFLAGIVLFSGSLYLLALTGMSVFTFFAPFGGANFLAGWASLAYAALTTGSTR